MTDTTAPAPAPTPRPRGRAGLLFPLILIGLGALFFAGNFGYIPPVSARALLQLWPLILVVVGIEMIVARRDPLLALVVEIVVVALAVGLVVAQPRGLFAPAAAGPSSSSVARGGAASMSLRIAGGAGTYTLSGGATELVEARSEGGEIRVRDDRRGDAANVRVQPSGFNGDIALFGGTPPIRVDVRAASDVPTSLRVEGGAGEFTLDLRDIRLKDARIETGASRVDLTLPRPSGDVPIRIQAGAASLTIVVPDEVEARVATTGGLLSTSLQNARFGSGSSAAFARSGGANETAGYAAAKDRVTITIEAGASSITIR